MWKFRHEGMMGHALRCCSFEIKGNRSDFTKKICSFLDYFFFYRSLKRVHLQVRRLKLQPLIKNKCMKTKELQYRKQQAVGLVDSST